MVSFPDFIQFSSHLLRGSLTQRSQRLHRLCSGSLSVLLETLQTLLETLSSSPPPTPSTSSWIQASPQSLSSLVNFLVKPLGGEEGVASGRSLSEDELESWLGSSSVVVRIIDVAFGASLYHRTLTSSEPTAELASLVGLPMRSEEGEGGEGGEGGGWDTQRVLVPLCMPSPSSSLMANLTSDLLSSAAALMINSYLPVEVRGQMYPLFLSGVHGQSFSTLCKSLVGSGPSLLLIRDSEGHVFGGFAAVSWQFGPQFIGQSSSLPSLPSLPSLGPCDMWLLC